jgi:hypothetical protein
VTELDEVADQLYAAVPEDFVALRADAAKQARESGDRSLAASIGKLRRPTVVAWLVNSLSRQQPDAVRELVELGRQFRAAQRSLDGKRMRELSKQRQGMLAQLTKLGQSIAGRDLTADVIRGFQQSLEAVLADADAAEQVTDGRLSTGLSYSGFGDLESDADDASAVFALAPGRAKRAARTGARKPPVRRAESESSDVEHDTPESTAAAAAAKAEAARNAARETAAREADDAAARKAAHEAAVRARELTRTLARAQRALDQRERYVKQVSTELAEASADRDKSAAEVDRLSAALDALATR